jgi:predicted anti-sigma-YlaC factor YlaD
MTRCESIREKLVLYAEGTLEAEERRQVDEHIAACAVCGVEAAQIARIQSWLSDPEVFGPEQDLAWQYLPERLTGRVAELKARKRTWAGINLAKWANVTILLIPIAIGLIGALLIPRLLPPANLPTAEATGNEAFLARMRTAYAREATAQYLSSCQDLLLDFVSSDKTCAGDRYDVSFEVTRARQLIEEKRMLDAQLQVPDVVHAKSLCDELEHFLVGLSMSQDCESGAAVHSMEQFIESKQLLLRINLMQSGIS